MHAIDVRTDPRLIRGNPIDLFGTEGLRVEVPGGGMPMYDVSADGERFLFPINEESQSTAGGNEEDDFRRVNVILNWTEELRDLVPVD